MLASRLKQDEYPGRAIAKDDLLKGDLRELESFASSEQDSVIYRFNPTDAR
jgi:hypothetical protein